ncbi:MAG: hypothetical protein MSC30_11460 [Gaiellaceae bacterium MAG52_C11]|nr:hypothetical protein [Candidatus Gaiellasilicea maunaloa]
MIEELVDSLLHEGYALYPYTPGAHKNATPTPFGIVYPVGYEHGYDHLRLECMVRGEDPELDIEVRFLQASGERHQAVQRRVGVGMLELPPLQGEIALDIEQIEPELHRVTLTIENRTPFAGGTRTEALERSLISTHPLLRVRGGTFVSPLEAPACTNVNTWPVLAAPDDTAILGAAIVLPDHPQLAAESLGSLFDGTEIEEALLLHVHALSDAEREEIANGDPTVREMVERALASTPDDIIRLHGLMRPVNAPVDEIGGEEPPVPPRPREEPATEQEATIDGRTFRLGDRLVMRLGDRIDTYDRMLDGRTATLERIYIDYDDKVHLGVTIDDDPGQELMRETGRFHFFFAGEVELVRSQRQEQEDAR